jgi:chemotaxis protein methyltransferase CheR
MRHDDCVRFLQEVLPRLGLRWAGYRRVHRTLCKRLGRRLAVLGFGHLGDYLAHLERHAREWGELEALCRIPISRFYRDRKVFEALERQVFAELAAAAARRGENAVRAWSCGCASGEEAYSLQLAWRSAGLRPGMRLEVLGTDLDETLLRRAEAACYRPSSLREVPDGLRKDAFITADGLFCLRPEIRTGVRFERQDLRREQPARCFDLIACRNMAFTYFACSLQRTAFETLDKRLLADGYLVRGRNERLPERAVGLAPVWRDLPIYRKRPAGTEGEGHSH